MTSAVPPQPTLTDGGVTLRPAGDVGAAATGFVVELAGEAVGSVEILRLGERDQTGRLSWLLDEAGETAGSQAIRMVVAYAFTQLDLKRVETYVDSDRRDLYRLAGRAGLRKEGVVRGHAENGGTRTDAWLMGRLATDPGPDTREAFIAALNSGLPTKRSIAQALIRNERGDVLLCELVYKKYWDLPGGVVDPHESPATAVLREIREELSVDGRIRSLAAVSWMPPWNGWDDATLFLFDVELPDGAMDRAALQPKEIRAVHWADQATLHEKAADYTARLVERATRQLAEGQGPAYLEDSIDPTW